MRKNKPSAPRKRTPKILPITEDAIISVLSTAEDYTVYKKQGSIMANEYTETLTRMLEEMNTQEEEKENLFSKEDVQDKEFKIVELEMWAIKLIEASERVFELIVFGVIKGTNEIVQSSFIQRRESSHCVVSKNTKYVLIDGIDMTIDPCTGFRESTKRKFLEGFPEDWMEIITAEIDHVKKKIPKKRGRKKKTQP